MLIHIPQVLTREQVRAMRTAIDAAPWEDGRASVGTQGALVKNNRQLPETHPVALEQGRIVLQALAANLTFFSAALPLRTAPPMFNRYAMGETYGLHVDGSVRQLPGTATRLRTDVSTTLFLSDPEDYDGGELVIQDTYGVQQVKLPAGDMVLYPGTSLHKVNAVTRGARFASFFWTQSLVREDSQRTLLFEMDNAIQQLTRDVPDHPSLIQLTGTYHNLLRRWVEV